VLNRRATEFRAVLGHSDDSLGTDPIRFRVILDGAEAVSTVVGFGSTETSELPVRRRILRLGLVASLDRLAGAGAETSQAVWADAQVTGGTGAIDSLVGATPGGWCCSAASR
jgi:hypothetical protein